MGMILEKLVRPSSEVKSRLHDRFGYRVHPLSVVKNLPRAFVSWMALETVGVLPRRPWISYDAVRVLEKKLRDRTCSVLEFGSGASTAWFARRAITLHSVENNAHWYDIVTRQLQCAQYNTAKIEYELRAERENFTNFRRTASTKYDIILIDGPWRHECAMSHAELLAEDGILYLDNSDADTSCDEPGEIRLAIEFLHKFALSRGLKKHSFTDFAPCALHATQGLMFSSQPVK
jgi:hypothetical protein